MTFEINLFLVPWLEDRLKDANEATKKKRFERRKRLLRRRLDGKTMVFGVQSNYNGNERQERSRSGEDAEGGGR
jgi:hypothetical protein